MVEEPVVPILCEPIPSSASPCGCASVIVAMTMGGSTTARTTTGEDAGVDMGAGAGVDTGNMAPESMETGALVWSGKCAKCRSLELEGDGERAGVVDGEIHGEFGTDVVSDENDECDMENDDCEPWDKPCDRANRSATSGSSESLGPDGGRGCLCGCVTDATSSPVECHVNAAWGRMEEGCMVKVWWGVGKWGQREESMGAGRASDRKLLPPAHTVAERM